MTLKSLHLIHFIFVPLRTDSIKTRLKTTVIIKTTTTASLIATTTI
jgi:hypothetical protein